jgi:hypothetical protein
MFDGDTLTTYLTHGEGALKFIDDINTAHSTINITMSHTYIHFLDVTASIKDGTLSMDLYIRKLTHISTPMLTVVTLDTVKQPCPISSEVSVPPTMTSRNIRITYIHIWHTMNTSLPLLNNNFITHILLEDLIY